MGQRLNIEIIKNDTPLANSYYHWSAYTLSSSILVNDIIDGYYDLKDKYSNNDMLLAIKILEATGAKLTQKAIKYIEENNLFKDEKFEIATDRNRGLISIYEEEMENTRDWEEGRVNIYLDEERVSFQVIWCLNKEEYEDELKENENEDEDLEYDNLPTLDIDFEIPFDKFKDVFLDIENLNSDAFKDAYGNVYQLIQ